jgi:hypothetical protein
VTEKAAEALRLVGDAAVEPLAISELEAAIRLEISRNRGTETTLLTWQVAPRVPHEYLCAFRSSESDSSREWVLSLEHLLISTLLLRCRLAGGLYFLGGQISRV